MHYLFYAGFAFATTDASAVAVTKCSAELAAVGRLEPVRIQAVYDGEVTQVQLVLGVGMPMRRLRSWGACPSWRTPMKRSPASRRWSRRSLHRLGRCGRRAEHSGSEGVAWECAEGGSVVRSEPSEAGEAPPEGDVLDGVGVRVGNEEVVAHRVESGSLCVPHRWFFTGAFEGDLQSSHADDADGNRIACPATSYS